MNKKQTNKYNYFNEGSIKEERFRQDVHKWLERVEQKCLHRQSIIWSNKDEGEEKKKKSKASSSYIYKIWNIYI